MTKHSSLTLLRIFFYIGLTCLAASLLISAIITKNNREQQLALIQLELENTSNSIGQYFSTNVLNLENIMLLASQKIKEDKKNINHINAILKDFSAIYRKDKNILSISMLSWVNDELHLISNSEKGTITPPIDLAHRDYIPKTIETPNKLIMGEAVAGAVSQQKIIPGGVGSYLPNGEYLGTLVAGIQVKLINERIEKEYLKPYIDYMLLDTNSNPLLTSTNNYKKQQLKNYKNNIETLKTEKKNAAYIATGPHEHLFISNVPRVPYYLVLSYNKNHSKTLLKQATLEGIVLFIVTILFFAALLLYLKLSIIKPIQKVSHCSKQISHGNLSAAVPRGGPLEIHELALQLINTKRYIKRILRTEVQLLEANAAADAANVAKSNFIAHMSHELRTPLNAVIGYSEIIRNELFGPIPEPRYVEYVDSIHKSGGHLLTLVNNILELTKAENSDITLNESTFNIHIVIATAIKTHDALSLVKNIRFLTNYQSKITTIYGDRARIQNMISNVIENSIKFGKEKGTIWLETFDKNDSLALKISDNGQGIKEQYLPHITERFFQVDSSFNRSVDGAGLGLWITKNIAELHGIKFSIRSKPGEGTVITFVFPKERIKKD